MSKPNHAFPLFFPALLLILQFFNNAVGQSVEVVITVLPSKIPEVRIQGRYPDRNGQVTRRNFSFERKIAGADIPGERISEVVLMDSSGKTVPHKELIPGEYLADSGFSVWTYKDSISPPEIPGQAAHRSWLSDNGGIIMLNDLLPVEAMKFKKALVTLKVPAGWSIQSSERRNERSMFEIDDVENAAFAIGSYWRVRKVEGRSYSLNLIISGQWLFNDDEAAQMAEQIFAEYQEVFKAIPAGSVQVILTKGPGGAAQGTWEGETRGPSIFLTSGDMPFKTQSMQRLNEQLRHEMFHLWLPNGVNLTGNYDWFYEGFALYQSLKTGVFLNRIRFDDFLDTLSRAYEIDAAIAKKRSLIDASAVRWRGSDTQVYARGMIVAFLCDLALLSKSGGKRAVEDVEREIFQKFRPPAKESDGNEAILAVMREHQELSPVIEKYIIGSDAIEWTARLALAGIEVSSEGNHKDLKVIAKPAGRQKTLLDKLGYNSWRKLSASSK